MIVDIVAAVMFSLILGFGLLGIVLYADSLFDKYINKDNYPQLVDKNINRTQKNDKIKKKLSICLVSFLIFLHKPADAIFVSNLARFIIYADTYL